MNLAAILAFLQPFVALLKPELMVLEGEGKTELAAIIADVSSPDLKALLMALNTALDGFVAVEIGKL